MWSSPTIKLSTLVSSPSVLTHQAPKRKMLQLQSCCGYNQIILYSIWNFLQSVSVHPLVYRSFVIIHKIAKNWLLVVLDLGKAKFILSNLNLVMHYCGKFSSCNHVAIIIRSFFIDLKCFAILYHPFLRSFAPWLSYTKLTKKWLTVALDSEKA